MAHEAVVAYRVHDATVYAAPFFGAFVPMGFVPLGNGAVGLAVSIRMR